MIIREDAIYGRQSVDRKDSISIESQIEFCKYELRGGNFRKYTDKGNSGKNTDRPKFQEMMADIRRGLILAGDLLAGLIYGLPFFLCGIICFTVKHRTGLWCGWAAYLCIDLYLRFATGLSWTTVFMTHLWTAQMNYARLAISWVQLLGMLVMIVCTVRSYRTLRLPATKKEGTWLIAGWLIALVVLPLLMSYGVMPLRNFNNYSNFSPYFFITVLYSYVRLALINVLLVRSLAVWRLKREEKKAEK